MTDILNLIGEARAAALEQRFEDAARLAADVLERLPTCLVALRILAWAQLERDDAAAVATFLRCAEHDPEDALAHVGQAIWYQQHDQDDVAVAEWMRAWELDPHNQAIRRGLARLTGELPESVFADAVSLLRAGRAEEAAHALKSLRGTADHDLAIEVALIGALWNMSAEREAFELATNVLQRHPGSVKAALYVAALEDRAGRTLRSREAIARAEQVDPGLTLFADVVRQVGLQAALDLHRASRASLAGAR
jgi:tetratricopeptide (TPR) repeat protein